MLRPLTRRQRDWVDRVLASMSLEQCVGHLLCPEDRSYGIDDWRAIVRDAHVGSVFIGQCKQGDRRACLEAIQEAASLPVLVAADMESGCRDEAGGTAFPSAMAQAAVGDIEFTRALGRALAIEARASGTHWSFSPVGCYPLRGD